MIASESYGPARRGHAWSSGEMCLRWTTAGMLGAETRFRKVEGHRSLVQLAIHIETDLIKRRHQLQPS